MKPRTTIIVAAVAALIVVSACSLAFLRGTDAPGDAPTSLVMAGGPRSIAVLGDSLTVQSSWAIDARAAERGYDVHVDADNGFRTRDKQDAAVGVAEAHPAAAVIALGTNDAACALANTLIPRLCAPDPEFSLADMQADMVRMAATLRQPGTCVVGVNVYFGAEVGQQYQHMVDDGALDGVIDWRTIVNADDSLRADGIGHLTHAGQEAFARRVVDETIRICGI